MSWHETSGRVEALFASASGERFVTKGDVLIGADGIHSQLRRKLYPDEGMPRWSGRLMWRGTANWSKFGAGKHFVVAGSNDTRLVLYPIGAGETDDTLLANWVLFIEWRKATALCMGVKTGKAGLTAPAV